MDMETVPGAFAGAVFALFGAALLVWTVTRAVRDEPVTPGAGTLGTAVAGFFAIGSLFVGVWLFLTL
ncbi:MULTISPECIES: hypothetical protein [unclassified Streptomyces]|uniref:hypothetical protein n=1 Tax=unclassified Streptomyces TaxID=2593676 RepID=UPI0037FCE410